MCWEGPGVGDGAPAQWKLGLDGKKSAHAGRRCVCQSLVADIFRPPQSSGSGFWGLRPLDPWPPSWAGGSAWLGPDCLQVLRCGEEAGPLQGHPANSLWAC